MENIARLNERRIDLRKHQAALIEAESASMESLGKCCKATVAFVDAFGDLKMSVVNPQVRDMLDRIPAIISQAASIPKAISEAHALAQSMVDASPYKSEIALTGGLPKRPPQQNG